MGTAKPALKNEVKTQRKTRNFFVDLIRRLFKEKPLGVMGFIIVVILLVVGIFAAFIAPEKGIPGQTPGYNVLHLADRFTPPFTNPHYLLGTDKLGRDLLSRVIYGAQLSMIVAVVGTVLQTIVSLAIGVACAYFGGAFDLIVQRFVDAWICFPGLVILITLMSIVGPGLVQILLVLGISGGIGLSRFKRALVFAIRENQYIYAAQATGARSFSVMWRHILPNIMPMVVVIFTNSLGGLIMYEASLSFLGLGLPPPYPSWGSMISGEGRANMLLAPWLILWPGLALSLVIFGINMFGDALRDLLDPRLRGGLGSYRLDKVEKISRKLKAKMEGARPAVERQISDLKGK